MDGENYTEGHALSDYIEAMSPHDELDDLIDEYTSQYDANKLARVGDSIICPVCRKKFVKGSYQQVFCVTKNKKHPCKDRYWNTVDESRRFRAKIFNK